MSNVATLPFAPARTRVSRPPTEAPRLFVVIDTEEEFDWHAPHDRTQTSVTAMKHIGRAQTLFDRYGLKPTYVIDYPVAQQPEGYALLKEYAASDRCTIGAHLHPWVTPPHDEPVNARNSFGCNLAPALEAAKIQTMVETIEAHLGVRPRAFKAGRYGIGAATVDTLERLGFEVDLSVNPHMDFSREQGPSFVKFDAWPFLLTGRKQPILFLPCTVGYVGVAGEFGRPLHAFASNPTLAPLRAVGVLSKLGITNRVMLSPEGNTLDEMKALARALHGRGLRTFSLTFHSPSVQPGHTPYVRSDADLREFLARIDEFCDFFFRELGGVPGRPLDYRATLLEESTR
jgi:uncharacterized protein Usg